MCWGGGGVGGAGKRNNNQSISKGDQRTTLQTVHSFFFKTRYKVEEPFVLYVRAFGIWWGSVRMLARREGDKSEGGSAMTDFQIPSLSSLAQHAFAPHL